MGNTLHCNRFIPVLVPGLEGHCAVCGEKRECGIPEAGCGCHGPQPRVEGFAVPCILLTIKRRPIHGYNLMERLGEMPFLQPLPAPGVVYRHLRRLEENGMVTSSLEPGCGGPARKVYSLTPDGEKCLEDWIARIGRRKESLEAFLQWTMKDR